MILEPIMPTRGEAVLLLWAAARYGVYRKSVGIIKIARDAGTINDLVGSATEMTKSNDGIEYCKVGGLTYNWSDHEYLRSDELLEVRDVSATDCHSDWEFRFSVLKDVGYDYSVTYDNFSWSDVKYVVPREFYITTDAICG